MLARRVALIAFAGSLALSAGCSAAPSKDGLVTKLRQVNGLSESQARCVADELFERIDADQLREAAKADNAGKVDTATITEMRQVIADCVPTATAD